MFLAIKKPPFSEVQSQNFTRHALILLAFCDKMRVQKWRSFSELLPLDLFAEGVGAPTAKAIVSETRPPCNLGRAGFLLAGENTFSKCPLVFKSNPCLKFNTPKFLVNGKKIFCENFCRPAPLTKNFFGVFFISQGLAFKKLLRRFFIFNFFPLNFWQKFF